MTVFLFLGLQFHEFVAIRSYSVLGTSFCRRNQCLGIADITAKVTGRRQEHNVVRAAFKALGQLESPQDAALRRGLQLVDLTHQFSHRRGESRNASKGA